MACGHDLRTRPGRQRRVTRPHLDSSPRAGKLEVCLAEVAEWQTRRTQNPLPARVCGFNSHLRHFPLLLHFSFPPHNRISHPALQRVTESTRTIAIISRKFPLAMAPKICINIHRGRANLHKIEPESVASLAHTRHLECASAGQAAANGGDRRGPAGDGHVVCRRE